MLKSLNGTRLGGLMLIVGIAVVFLSGIFSPAVLIIDMVTGIEPANVEERLVAKVTNPDATNVTATFYLLGHVVLLGGLFALWPRGRGTSRGDVMMRTGILAITVSIICGIGSAVLDYVLVVGNRIGLDLNLPTEQFWPFLQTFNAVDVVVEATLLLTAFSGHVFLALGLCTMFAPGRRKTAAVGMSLISLAALVLFLVGIHADGASVLTSISSIALVPITLWLIALGVLLYKEDTELVGEPASA